MGDFNFIERLIMLLIFYGGIIAIYLWASIGIWKRAKKVNHNKPWISWIPFANIGLSLSIAGYNWNWIFLNFIPLLGAGFFFRKIVIFQDIFIVLQFILINLILIVIPLGKFKDKK